MTSRGRGEHLRDEGSSLKNAGPRGPKILIGCRFRWLATLARPVMSGSLDQAAAGSRMRCASFGSGAATGTRSSIMLRAAARSAARTAVRSFGSNGKGESGGPMRWI